MIGAVVGGITLAPQANAVDAPETGAVASGVASAAATPLTTPTISVSPSATPAVSSGSSETRVSALPASDAASDAASAAPTSPITYTYAGDSITARPDSWLHQLQVVPSTGLTKVRGFAVQGYTSAEVLAGVAATTADVLVIEVGTNDVRYGLTTAHLVQHIDAIARRSGAAHVALVALPPSDVTSQWKTKIDRRAVGAETNARLKQLAAARGWTFGDPFSQVRTADNGYASGASVDGVHPTTATNVVVMHRMAALIRQAAASH